MKKILMSAMALPLILAACSAEEDIMTANNANDLYPEVAKVDASFDLEQLESRLSTKWGLENGDQIGLAWLGEDGKVKISGLAYQNHPLTANQNGTLVPQTSIYVGKYFSYFPYDVATQKVKEIDFSVEKQDLLADYDGLAKKSIWISPRLTNVVETLDWNNKDQRYEDLAGVGNTFHIYPRQFSNIVGLALGYINNTPETGTPEIKSIKISYTSDAAGTNVVSVKSFSYAPKTDLLENWGNYNVKCTENIWADYNLSPSQNSTTGGIPSTRADEVPSTPLSGVTAEEGAITLTPSSTYYAEGNGGSFMYNALPANEKVTADHYVKFEISTTYGVITFTKKVTEVAYTNIAALGKKAEYKDNPDGKTTDAQGNKLTDAKKGLDIEQSFIQRLYKTGKIVTDVDFYTAIMNNMHVEDDAELQKILNYYYAYKLPSMSETKDYSESNTGVTLYLDGTNGYFDLSKTSLALVQKINAEAISEYGYKGQLIKLEACNENGITNIYNELYCETTRVALTEGAELPNLNNVFGNNTTTVYLSADDYWTWAKNEGVSSKGNGIVDKYGKFFGNITKIVNEGNLEISIDNVWALEGTNNVASTMIVNEGEMTIADEVNFHLGMDNLGEITVNYNAAMFAYDAEINNDVIVAGTAAAPQYKAEGKVYNYGVIGVVSGTSGVINNYGYIKNNDGAKTYVTNNQTASASFGKNIDQISNKMGTIELTTATDNVSVKANTTQGFIKYVWDGGSVYSTPAKDVRYNYLIVKSSIKFTEPESELQYLEVAGSREVVITAPTNDKLEQGESLFTDTNKRLKGFIVNVGSEANIKEGNQIYADAAYIGGRLYLGGIFYYRSNLKSFYGDWLQNHIIEQ